MFCCRSSRTSDDDPRPPRSQRRSRRNGKNPYSNRGQEKLAKLMEDLKERREKILARTGNEDVSLIRFIYSSSRGWIPVVVKIKDRKQVQTGAPSPKNHPIQHKSEEAIKFLSGSSAAVKDVVKSDAKMKKSFSSSLNKSETALWRPCYWPVVALLILVCLMVFGRSFAIICTAICWYLLPTLKRGGVNMRRSMKKEYEREG